MNVSLDKNSKYNNILNRIQKKYITFEGIFILKKMYLTNNIIYYFLCVLFRFVHLASFSGNYVELLSEKDNETKSFQEYLKLLTCSNIAKQFQLSFEMYRMIVYIILILFLLRLIIILYQIKQFKNYKNIRKWPLPNNYQIVIEHIVFLLFPYIIEFLSFPYYMYFFSNKFIINVKGISKTVLMIIIVINTLLIIGYNIGNYINFVCSNKIYTKTLIDAYKNHNNHSKLIAYKCSNLFIYILTFFQNFVIFFPLENYLKNKSLTIFKIITSVVELLSIFILFIDRSQKFDYINNINTTVSILILFCFYSILIDFILYALKYRLYSLTNEIIYVLIKFFLSYTSYLLYLYRIHKIFESEIIKILFQEKNNKNDNLFMNSFYYLHQLMIKLKEQDNIESIIILVRFLKKHINICNKIVCNCKLFRIIRIVEKNDNLKNEKLKEFLSELLINLNYLFESAFIECDIYNKYDLAILLAEHFCHLKDNPLMAFSIINTLVSKQRNEYSKFQIIILYELSQKYIYYMTAKIMKEIEIEAIQNNKIELLFNKNKEEEFQKIYNYLKMSYFVKRHIINYIDNEIKILKYRIIFEDSLSFKFDDNMEGIDSVKINFFNQSIKVENLYKDAYDKNKRKDKNKNSNLYYIIFLLKNEQFYYSKIIKSLKEIEVEDIPIFMIFKYFLFFDIFEGGKIPEELNKLYNSLTNNQSLNNKLITANEFSILKNKYNEQNYKIDSRFYVIVELKKDLRTKYFSENCALKLGYKQNDIINKSIDILMPKEFCKSHQNVIKQLIIGNQIRYSMSKQSYFFDKSSTILYSANFEVSLIYNMSKSLIIISESIFNYEKEYRFMLNNNFELIANSKNFEDEYYLNKKIFQAFNIGLMDILSIKPLKLHKIFENEFKKIHYQKAVRLAKTEEYFIPQLFVPPGDKVVGIAQTNFFNTSKNNILHKILNLNTKEENSDNLINNEDSEEISFFKKDKNPLTINYLFENQGEVTFHKIYNKTLNKGRFIENLAKELTKIPDNDLMMENDKNIYNLITSSKQLVSKLLTRNELTSFQVGITLKFGFYYDNLFYFVTLYDEKKLYLKISKTINFENSENNLIQKKDTNSNNDNKNKIPFNKSRNKNFSFKNKIIKGRLKNKSISLINEKVKTLNKINDFRKKINKDKFISIIKYILSIIIICILIIYILIINYQSKLIKTSQKILYSYCYNFNSRDIILYIFSILFQIYFDHLKLVNNTISNDNQYQEILSNLTLQLKDNYHEFYNNFVNYNLEIGHEFDLVFTKKKFTKLIGYWEETEYESKYSSELDFLIYTIFKINITHGPIKELDDLENLIFFQDRSKTQEKINSSFVQLIYYIAINYEFVYKDIFKEIGEEILHSFKNHFKINTITYILLEVIGLLFYLLFYIAVIFYLYYSNNVIIKNIIFLFLDFSELFYDKNKVNSNIISFKLLEFEKLIDDFDLNNLKKYSEKLDSKVKKSVNNNSVNNRDIKSIFILNLNSLGKSESKNEPSANISNNDNNKNLSIKKKDSLEFIKNAVPDDTNNSSQEAGSKNNLLMNSSYIKIISSFSSFFKDKLKNNINKNKEVLNNNNHSKNISSQHMMNNSSSSMPNNNQNRKYNSSKKNDKEEEINKKETINFQEIVLNKSNRSIILIIKIFLIVISFFMLVIIVFNIFKLRVYLSFKSKYHIFFIDYSILTDRYSMLFYYFNTLKTLLIFPDDNRKRKLEEIFENMNEFYENENNKYNNILQNNIGRYPQLKKLFILLQDTKNDPTEIIKEEICSNILRCKLYLDSIYNIFTSGIDFAFRTGMTQVSNYYNDYKKLSNKLDMDLIKMNIINSPHFRFVYIAHSLNNIFLYVKQKIFILFMIDENNFINSYNNKMNMLNSISIIFPILIFLFVIVYIFISISKFTGPIKDSTYRINCSFYYIKKYNFTINRINDKNIKD